MLVVVAAEVVELRDELLVVVVLVGKARYVAWPWYSAFEYAVTPSSSSTVKLDAVASEPDEENPFEGLAVARREKTADASEALLDEEADAFEEENAGDEGVYVPGRRVICRVDPLTGEETTTPACERVRGSASAPTERTNGTHLRGRSAPRDRGRVCTRRTSWSWLWLWLRKAMRRQRQRQRVRASWPSASERDPGIWQARQAARTSRTRERAGERARSELSVR